MPESTDAFHRLLESLSLPADAQEQIAQLARSLVATEHRAVTQRDAMVHAILETSVDGIITIDEQGRIESFNAAAERLFGYTVEEVMGQNVSMLMPSPDREQHDGYLKAYRETGEPRIIGTGRQVRARRKDGTTFPIDLAISEVQLGDRRIFTGIVHDLTDRKRAEAALVSISERVRRDIGQELHDALGQHLTGLTLLAKSLTDSLDGAAPETRERAANLVELSRSAVAQVRQLSHGLYPLTLTRDGLEGALLELAGTMPLDSRVTCRCLVNGETIPMPTSIALHFFRIAQEAVTNALKYAHATQIELRIHFGPQHVILEIEDDGAGFDPAGLTQEGLGLMIMRHRADLVGGTLTIHAHPGSGCRISVAVPTNHLESDEYRERVAGYSGR